MNTVFNRDHCRVWGFTPHAGVDQSSMTRLFEMQNRLKADLRRQARLLKIDVAEVRSTQAEQLRMVNEAMLHASSSELGVENPFSVRNLTDAQLRTERMVRESGKKTIGGAPVAKPTRPSAFLIKKHRPDAKAQEDCPPRRLPPLEKCFTLKGPLLRDFSRAVSRGYKGPPNRWLRGPGAVAAWSRARKKISDLPHPREHGIFNPRSPLHWAVSSSSGMRQHNLRRGFRAERLNSDPTNFVVLCRQAASVKRLKLSDWPSLGLGRSWPTFPTLNESWEMVVRGKYPANHTHSASGSEFLRPTKLPLKLVKPGSAARVVSKCVLGIRADVEVPRKFLAYFQYRWGFLILQRKWALPKELSAMLIALWKADITKMFLVCPIRYNDALRRIPSNAYYALNGFLPGSRQRTVAAHDTVPSKRKRPPRRERQLANSSVGSKITGKTCEITPSPDKSDGGVRLF
jgi:hypothetical protein